MKKKTYYYIQTKICFIAKETYFDHLVKCTYVTEFINYLESVFTCSVEIDRGYFFSVEN